MDYRILHMPSIKELEDAVNALIDKNWKPIGGISMITNAMTTLRHPEVSFAQVMVWTDTNG